MKHLIFTIIIVAGCCFMFTGCSGSPFRVEYVEGTVTLDGAAVEGATVTFVPVDTNTGKSAYAGTDVAGKFKLTAVQGGKSNAGTVAGKYQVAISKNVPSREPAAKELEALEAGTPLPDIPMTAVVPEKYNDIKTSGLTAEVVNGNNTFKFELKK